MAFRKKVKLQMFVSVLNKPLSTMEHILPFKHQSYKMVRHAQTIRRLLPKCWIKNIIATKFILPPSI